MRMFSRNHLLTHLVLCLTLCVHGAGHATERSGVFKNMQGEVKVIRAGKSLPAASGAGLFSKSSR